jgi:hypothetical protein
MFNRLAHKNTDRLTQAVALATKAYKLRQPCDLPRTTTGLAFAPVVGLLKNTDY